VGAFVLSAEYALKPYAILDCSIVETQVILKLVYVTAGNAKLNFNLCSTVPFFKYEIFLVQQMHNLLKHKILQFVFKCLNVCFSAPTCFGPLGPSSGSIHQNLAKVTKITVF
jgi:hypothetical protein